MTALQRLQDAARYIEQLDGPHVGWLEVRSFGVMIVIQRKGRRFHRKVDYDVVEASDEALKFSIDTLIRDMEAW